MGSQFLPLNSHECLTSTSNSTRSPFFASPLLLTFFPSSPHPTLLVLLCSLKDQNLQSQTMTYPKSYENAPPPSAFHKCVRHCAGCQGYMASRTRLPPGAHSLAASNLLPMIPPVQTHIPALLSTPPTITQPGAPRSLREHAKTSLQIFRLCHRPQPILPVAAHYLKQVITPLLPDDVQWFPLLTEKVPIPYCYLHDRSARTTFCILLCTPGMH